MDEDKKHSIPGQFSVNPILLWKNKLNEIKKYALPPRIKCIYAVKKKFILLLEPSHVYVNKCRHIKISNQKLCFFKAISVFSKANS